MTDQHTDSTRAVVDNDVSLDNAAVIAKLSCDWTAVGVKLRSARLAAHAVVTRTGGAKGSPAAIPAKDLTYEAKLYKANGVIQPAQARGQVYQLMTKAQYTAATNGPVAADSSVATAAAAATAADTTVKTADTAATAPAAATAPVKDAKAFSFTVNLLGRHGTFAGPDKQAALNALHAAITQLTISKATFAKAETPGISMAMADVVNGGNYVLVRQTTAARPFGPLSALALATRAAMIG